MPKFSWCDGSTKASAAWNAPHLGRRKASRSRSRARPRPASREAFHLRLPIAPIRPGHHQMEVRDRWRRLGRMLSAANHILFWDESGSGTAAASGLPVRMGREELMTESIRITHRSGCAVIHDDLAALISAEGGGEGLSGQTPLFFTCEQHPLSIPQHAALRPRPVKAFLQVLERVGVLEPRVQHPMCVNKIGSPGVPKCLPGTETAVLP